jgi:DNA gyrase subunit A
MRYTESRMSKPATYLLADLDKDTVDFQPNYDGQQKEPVVLPAQFPNLLVNGGSGIAVGMATNIPPHNLGEVCDALCYLIDRYDRHDDVTVEDLMQFIPGPDFPTGGVIYRYQREGSGETAEQVDVIAHAYAGGKGHIVMQAKAHIEDMSRNRARIVVTELPYMTNKTNLLERIAELVRDGRLDGITDLRDESDRTGMRICIEMTRTVEPREVLASLFKLTPLQQTFGVSLLALVDNEPRLLSLKRMLMYFLEHRQEVIVRRSKYELAKAKARAHILEGLLRALDVLDEIIALIRASKTADIAKQGLIKEFKFSEIQAQAILDMQLRRLAALERRKLQDEYREVIALIRTLEELLNSPKKVLALIKQNLIDLKARYGDARRTQIADRVQGTLTTHDLLPNEDVWVTLSPEGTLTKWRRGDSASEPKGKAAPPHLRAPAPQLAAANTRDDLYLFSVKGQATRIGAHQVPEGSGSHFADLSGLTRRDRIAALIALPKSSDQLPASCFLLLATVQGKVKRVAVADLMDQGSTDPQVIGLDDGDELLWAGISPGGGEFLLVTAQGQAIRFAEEDVRAMGLPAGGIGGVKLATKDRVVAAIALVKDGATQPHVVLITTLGIGKRVPVADFPAQGRNGQGVVAAKPSPKLGNVAGAALAGPSDTLLCLTAGGGARPIPAAAVPEMGRPAQGKSVIPLVGGDQVTRIVGVAVEQSRGKAEVEVKVEAKAEAKAETKTRKAATRPPEVASTAAKKPAVRPASGAKAAAPTKVGAASKVGKATAGVAKPSPAPAVPPPTRKAAAAQPTLLPSEQATPASKQPAKPAATPPTEPTAKPTGRSIATSNSTAPAAEPAKPTSRSAAKNASTVTKTESVKPAARATTKPAATAPKTGAAQAPARPAAKSEPAAPAEKPAARKVPPEKAGGTSAKPVTGKASGPSSKI